MDANELEQRIEAYLRGELPPTERQSFEAEMAADPDLRRETLVHYLAEQAVERAVEADIRSAVEAVRENQRSFAPPSPTTAEKTNTVYPGAEAPVIPLWRRPWFQVAVAVSAAALLLFLFFPAGQETPLPKTSSKVQALELLELPENNLTLGDSETEQQFARARNLFFVKEDYAAAAEQLRPIAGGDSDRRYVAELLLAYSLLMQEDYAAAIPIFESFLAQPAKRDNLPVLYQSVDKLRWDLILANLGQGNDQAVQSMLDSFPPTADPYYLEKVNKLRSNLSE